jgi:cobyrinic acid a,c-diamide synthase
MGFYDGIDRGSSTWDVTSLLDIPVVLVLPAAGASHSIAAHILGLLEYKEKNTIAAVVLNHISSESHYQLLKQIIDKDFPDLIVAGWIPANLEGLNSRHLGLDTSELIKEKIRGLTEKVLEHIDLEKLSLIWNRPHGSEDQLFLNIQDDKKSYILKQLITNEKSESEKQIKGTEGLQKSSVLYPFEQLTVEEKSAFQLKKLIIVYDRAFSFLYKDNIEYLKEIFGTVRLISALDNEAIPSYTDTVYLPGGYVETPEIYFELKKSLLFRDSLISHVNKGKKVYGECAGLLYLGRTVFSADGEPMPMSGILPLDFQMRKTRKRLGYYNTGNHRGHSFHYSEPVLPALIPSRADLIKPGTENGEPGSWQQAEAFGTYLHSMFRNQPEIIRRYF